MSIPVNTLDSILPKQFSILPPQIEDEEGSVSGKFKIPVTEELNIELKEIRASIDDQEPDRTKKLICKLFLNLLENCGHLNADEVLYFIRCATDILGERMLEREYQRAVCPYLLSFIKIYTRIVFKPVLGGNPQAVLDLYFLSKIKEIYKPYFLGLYYDNWKENFTDFIAFLAKCYNCTSYELVEYVSNLTMMDVLFINDDLGMEKFKVQLIEKTNDFSFEFLKRLIGFEISLQFFYSVIKEAVYGQMTHEQIEITGQYLKMERLPLCKAVDMLEAIEKNCVIDCAGWHMLLGAIFEKIMPFQRVLFVDAWNLMKFVFSISKKIDLNRDIQEQIYTMFEKKIVMKILDKSALNPLRYDLPEQEKFINSLVEGLKLLDTFENEAQRNGLIQVLLGIAIIHMQVLRSENGFKFIENLAPKLHSNYEIDILLLKAVTNLICCGIVDKKDCELILPIKLASLSLFKNSDLHALLRNWNELSADSNILCPDVDFLAAAISMVFKISKRELILHLFVLPIEVVNLDQIKRKLFLDSIERVEPTESELVLIKQVFQMSKISMNRLIDFFNYLLCLYILPTEVEEGVLRKILCSSVKTVNGERHASTDPEGKPIVRYDAKKTDGFDYGSFRAILKLLAHGFFSSDMKNFGKNNSNIIVKFLKSPFCLEKVFDISVLQDEKKTSYLFEDYNRLMLKIVEVYGIEDKSLIPEINVNWILACSKLYSTYRRSAMGLAQTISIEGFRVHYSNSYFSVKQSLLQMVVGSYRNLCLLNSTRLHAIQNPIRLLNRPLLVALLPDEPILKFVKKKLMLRKHQP